MKFAKIIAIEYELPGRSLTNEELSAQFPEWDVAKIFSKTGISDRRIVAEGECASDLAFRACEKIFASGAIERSEVDCLILCTQSPDYVLPATACILQHRLGLPTKCAAFDYNQGCSGFIYGLGLAKGLVETGQVRNVLLVTAETYSKYINEGDKSVRTLFGDAAAATLIQPASDDVAIDRFRYGTDGSGAGSLIVPVGGSRLPAALNTELEAVKDGSGNVRTDANLYMDGAAVLEFTLKRVPELFESLFDEKFTLEMVDHFVFHQANKFMLDTLNRRLKLPEEKFVREFEHCGNTVSSTIPIALKESLKKGNLKPGDMVACVGFGVGLSWAACTARF